MQNPERFQENMNKILKRMKTVILGQDQVVEQFLTCFIAGGHVLFEGVPGLGKTLLARTLAKLVNAEYRRIQFTPDLLPSDITGTMIFNPKTGEFNLHKGPIFTEALLADEINRTPPKTQAALLEAMEERQVTLAGERNPLPDLFFVMATQNPIEYEGTYPLPETQLDRFMMKVVIDYPSAESEAEIVRSYAEGKVLHDLDTLIPSPMVDAKTALKLRALVDTVTVSDAVVRYIQQIIAETRDDVYVQLGASTRAGIALLRAARALAAIRGMSFVGPDEVKEIAIPVLRHRTILRPEALIDGLTGDSFLENILQQVPVPR